MNLCFTETIKDYPDYIICKNGEVISLARKIIRKNGRIQTFKSKILKTRTGKRGYPYIFLSHKKKSKARYIHRLVAEAFIPNPYHELEINHIDGNKKNHSIKNLEWCNRKENCQHAHDVLKIKTNPAKGVKHYKAKPVNQYNLNGDFVKRWNFAKEAEKEGYSHSKISLCCNGKRNKHKNFIWRFANE